jgi:ATP-dependent RNA helicase SUPV3L1/SUV3
VGAARGLAFALAEGLGAAPRRAVAQQVAALSSDDRRALARLGVNLGRLAVFLPALQKPESSRLRARLFGVRHGHRLDGGPDGAPSVPNDLARPLGFYLACGYLPVGPRAVRLDRLERAAALCAGLSRTGPFAVPRELTSILGCPQAELGGVLSAIGYVERDGRFERRVRPARHGLARGA